MKMQKYIWMAKGHRKKQELVTKLWEMVRLKNRELFYQNISGEKVVSHNKMETIMCYLIVIAIIQKAM